MKRFAAALALACALSSATLAGNIPTSGIVSPPPPPPETQQSGEMPTCGLLVWLILDLTF